MKAAVLGFGKMGKQVVEHLLASEHVSEVVVCDPSAAALSPLKDRPRVSCAAVASALADPAVRVVFVTAPNDQHRGLTVQALRAGKAVMCEKPIATILADAETVVGESETAGAFLQIGFELRYSRLYTTARQWIDQGLVGTVLNTTCLYVCTDFSGTGSWRLSPERAGTMFGEKLSHYVDLPRWWIGKPVTEVFTACAPNAISHYRVRDNYHTTYCFAGGAVSHLSFMMAPAGSATHDPLTGWSADLAQVGHELRYIIQGDQGAIETNVYERRLRRWKFTLTPERLESHLAEELTWDARENNVWYHNTEAQTHDIVWRVATGRGPMTRAADALETMRLCFAAERSAELARPVRLDELAVAGKSS